MNRDAQTPEEMLAQLVPLANAAFNEVKRSRALVAELRALAERMEYDHSRAARYGTEILSLLADYDEEARLDRIGEVMGRPATSDDVVVTTAPDKC